MPRHSVSRLVLVVAFLSLVLAPLAGCGSDATPTTPDEDALQNYLNENPEAATRIDVEEDVETDG